MKKSLMGIVFAAVVLTPAAVFALGFQNPDQGARATGQGEAFVAQADDASAIYYNPAGLTQVKGTQLTSGGYLSFGKAEFKETGGQDFKMTHTAVLPHFYAATDFGLERWRFGLGVNLPFGNAVDWGSHGPFELTSAKLTVISVQPTVAYQINDSLSVGAGLDVYYGTTDLKENVSPLAGGGLLHFKGDGTALGATVGLLWKINAQNAVGFLYRSPFRINFEDSVQVHGSFLPYPPYYTGRSDGSASIEFPQTAKIGYAFRPIPQWKIEADVEWVNWDSLNQVVLHSPNPVFDGMTIPYDWKDSYYYELGTEYQFNNHWVARAGYIYSTKTVPDQTFSPAQPDNTRHVISGGLGYSTPRFQLDVVYQYTLMEERKVTSSPFTPPGVWKGDNHLLMMTTTFRF